MAEPVSLDEIKTHLRLDVSETGEDDYLESLITASRRAIEKKIRRSVLGGDAVLTLPGFPPNLPLPAVTKPAHVVIDLPGGVIAAVASITYYDGSNSQQTLAAGSYVASLTTIPAKLAPVGCWPISFCRPDAVTINYTEAALDDDDLSIAAQIIKLTVGTWYRNREHTQVDARGTPTEIPGTAAWLIDTLSIEGRR